MHTGSIFIMSPILVYGAMVILYLVHGELNMMLELQSRFHTLLQWHANIPSPAQTVEF